MELDYSAAEDSRFEPIKFKNYLQEHPELGDEVFVASGKHRGNFGVICELPSAERGKDAMYQVHFENGEVRPVGRRHMHDARKYRTTPPPPNPTSEKSLDPENLPPDFRRAPYQLGERLRVTTGDHIGKEGALIQKLPKYIIRLDDGTELQVAKKHMRRVANN